jgi:hypothetical protein
MLTACLPLSLLLLLPLLLGLAAVLALPSCSSIAWQMTNTKSASSRWNSGRLRKRPSQDADVALVVTQ